MSAGRANAGYNVIHQSFASNGRHALAHVLYLLPFVIGTFVLFPAITRDSSLLEGVLELDHEAVQEVKKIEREVLESRDQLTRAIYQYVLSDDGEGLRRQLGLVSPEEQAARAVASEHPEHADARDECALHLMHHHADENVHIDDLQYKKEIVEKLFDIWRPQGAAEISREVFARHLKGIHFHMSRLELRRLLRLLDPDQSGHISREEWCGFLILEKGELNEYVTRKAEEIRRGHALGHLREVRAGGAHEADVGPLVPGP
jgi:hypothetical protein